MDIIYRHKTQIMPRIQAGLAVVAHDENIICRNFDGITIGQKSTPVSAARFGCIRFLRFLSGQIDITVPKLNFVTRQSDNPFDEACRLPVFIPGDFTGHFVFKFYDVAAAEFVAKKTLSEDL